MEEVSGRASTFRDRWSRVVLVLAIAAAPGCAGGRPESARPSAAPPPAARPLPGPGPDLGWMGRVVQVNPVLRFVVLDFPIGKVPPIDQRLNVYHGGQKTGEVKVTGPTRDTTTAGDLLTGTAQAGDEVRDD